MGFPYHRWEEKSGYSGCVCVCACVRVFFFVESGVMDDYDYQILPD